MKKYKNHNCSRLQEEKFNKRKKENEKILLLSTVVVVQLVLILCIWLIWKEL
jgi:hypothetical protein